MEFEKLKKIFSAAAATAVLLLFILLSVMTYQMILIKKSETKISELDAEREALITENEQTTDQIALWQNRWKIEEKARELGWLYGEDK